MNSRTSGLLAALVVWSACSAPASERATGELAAAMERSLAGGTASFDHSLWDSLLASGTNDGFVDYAYMAGRADDLSAYISSLAAVDLGSLAPPDLMALLINAYNALTVQSILDHPTVSSIRDIDGVWTGREWDVGGQSVTLDNLEHNLLRPFFRDPRIHFAVNCASHSCAPLPGWAFTGAELEAQLEERSRAFLTNQDNVRLDGGTLVLSRYFDWYGGDFIEEGWDPRAESIPAFVARYATDDVREAIEADPAISIRFEDYDWTLNAATPPPQSSSSGESGSSDETGGLSGLLSSFQSWVNGFGALAPVVYGLGYIVFVVLLVPGGALTLGAGFSFGFGVGFVVVFIGANIGAALAFLVARYFLRARVERWLAGRDTLSAIDRAVEEQGWRVVALTRLSPVFPFNVQNYFYGLTGVSFGGYVIASLIGMLPGTLLYVYIGVAGVGVAQAAGGAASWGETALLIAGLLATFLVVALITRVAKRELDRVTSAPEARAAAS